MTSLTLGWYFEKQIRWWSLFKWFREFIEYFKITKAQSIQTQSWCRGKRFETLISTRRAGTNMKFTVFILHEPLTDKSKEFWNFMVHEASIGTNIGGPLGSQKGIGITASWWLALYCVICSLSEGPSSPKFCGLEVVVNLSILVQTLRNQNCIHGFFSDVNYGKR